MANPGDKLPGFSPVVSSLQADLRADVPARRGAIENNSRPTRVVESILRRSQVEVGAVDAELEALPRHEIERRSSAPNVSPANLVGHAGVKVLIAIELIEGLPLS